MIANNVQQDRFRTKYHYMPLSSRTPCTASFPMPGEDSNYMEEQRSSFLCQPPGREVQSLLPIASRYTSCQGKHNAVKHCKERFLFTQRKDRTRSTPIVCVIFTWPVSPPFCASSRLTQGNWSV